MAGHRESNRARIRRFCLMDDDFMNICFTDLPCVELVLRIVLDKPDLTVKRSQVQKLLKGPDRSIWLDIYAKDAEERDYDIELQRDSRGADPRRARFHSSMLDTLGLRRRQRFTKLRESCVIFITETDVLKQGLPLYTIERHVRETGSPFGDGSRIIYVNGAARDADTPLGRLMHDFFCADPNEMNYSLLAERTRFLKEDEREVRRMSRIMNEIRREGRVEGRREGRVEGRREGRVEGRVEGAKEARASSALKLLKIGKLTLAEIADIVDLTLNEVQALQRGMA